MYMCVCVCLSVCLYMEGKDAHGIDRDGPQQIINEGEKGREEIGVNQMAPESIG